MKTDRSRSRAVSTRRSARAGGHRPRPASPPAGIAADLSRRWQSALTAIEDGQREVQRQLGALRQGRVGRVRLAEGLQAVRLRLDREGRKAGRELEKTLSGLQVRLREQGSALAGRVERTVRRTLAALDLPSRREVTTLTRRVEQLSRKIDKLPAARTPRRPVRGRA